MNTKTGTIEIVNPSNPHEVFVVFPREVKGHQQDGVSMAVVDETGRTLTDWGSHINVKGAIKFAHSRGFTERS